MSATPVATLFVFAIASAPRALAMGAAVCEGVVVEGAPGLASDWADAVRDARDHLPAAVACAAFAIRIEPTAEGEVRVLATAADGRLAARIVRRPMDLEPAILGLVLSIPPDAEPAIPYDAPPAPQAPHVSTATSAPARLPVPSGEPVEVWVGGAVGARLGEPTQAEMLDLEARADVVVKHWLLFLSFRYAPGLKSGADRDDQSYEETDIGVGAGRREAIGNTAFDIALLPSLATMSFDDESGTYDAHGGTRSQLRLGISLRWSFPVGKYWRLGITVDTDVAPQGLRRAVRLDPEGTPLPAWTGGLRFGAAGALL